MRSDPETWYASLTDGQRRIALALRQLILDQAASLREEIKWGQPCFSGVNLVCYLQKSKTHLSLGFGRGAELADPDGLLHGSGGQMRHAKTPLTALDLDHGRLGALVQQASALDGMARARG